jgi:hypothetical protein
MLEFNNFSAISKKEEEQVIEDVFHSILPNNSNNRIDENCTIPENSRFLDSKNLAVPVVRVPQIITDVALEQEIITTTNQPTGTAYPKIYKYNEKLENTSDLTIGYVGN